MKVILQRDSSDCGLACLAMIASYYGLDTRPDVLRSEYASLSNVARLSSIIRIAGGLNFSSRPLRLELSEFTSLKLPCVLHWDQNHYVVLEKIKRNQVHIIDPAFGRDCLSFTHASARFTGVALEITPNQSFSAPTRRPKIRISDIFEKAVGFRTTIATIFAFALSLELISIGVPQLTRWIVDGALASADHDILIVALFGGCLLVLADFGLRIGRGMVELGLAQQLSLTWKSHLFNHLLRLPWTYFQTRSIGDIATSFASIDIIRNHLITSRTVVVLDGIAASITLAFMLAYSFQLTAVVIVALALYATVRLAFHDRFVQSVDEHLSLIARQENFFLESLKCIVPIKLSNAIDSRVAEWQNHLINVRLRETRNHSLSMWFSSLNTLILGTEGAVLLYVGGNLVISGGITLGVMLAFFAYKAQFSARVTKLIDIFFESRTNLLHVDRVSDIASVEVEHLGELGLELPPCSEPVSIEFRNVSYRYSTAEAWAVFNASFVIRSGESIAIVGQSASGKSTLLKLLLGLLEPTEGEIFLGGLPYCRLGLNRIRRFFGVVSQNDSLLSGTVAQNISFFDTDADQERVEKVAYMANIDQEISLFPMRYQTSIGGVGDGISGGQKQRLLLARALYSSPRFLLLDEALSQLDPVNSLLIGEKLRRENISMVHVTHQGNDLEHYDRLFLVRLGVITETDPRAPSLKN